MEARSRNIEALDTAVQVVVVTSNKPMTVDGTKHLSLNPPFLGLDTLLRSWARHTVKVLG